MEWFYPLVIWGNNRVSQQGAWHASVMRQMVHFGKNEKKGIHLKVFLLFRNNFQWEGLFDCPTRHCTRMNGFSIQKESASSLNVPEMPTNYLVFECCELRSLIPVLLVKFRRVQVHVKHYSL